MQQRNISKKIQRQVLKYIEYEQSQEEDSYQKGEEILLNISKSLRDEVNKEYFGKFLNDIKLFKLNFSVDFILKLTSHIKERTYGPNEIIFSKGDQDRNFYFICSGSVQLYLNRRISQNREDDFDLISVGKGSLLGLNSFLTGNPKDMSAKSLNVSHLVYCSENDFLQTIKMFEMDYEKYCMLRDSVNLYKDHQGLPCFSCYKFDHQTANCSLYNLRVDKELVNLRHVYCPQQMRKANGRQLIRRKNISQALMDKQRLFYVQELYGFSDDDEDEEDEDDESDMQENQTLNSTGDNNLKEQSIVSQKLTLEDRINLYKEDKDFFYNIQKLRQKDLQLYILHKKSQPEMEFDLTYVIQEDDPSQYQQDPEETEEDKYNQTNSISTPDPIKQSSESSFLGISNLKLEKNVSHFMPSQNQSSHLSNRDSQNHYPSSSNLQKQGYEQNSFQEIRNKSISNSSQLDQSQGVCHLNANEGRRQSQYKQLNLKQRQSINQNLDHEIKSPNSKTQQSLFVLQEEDGNNQEEKIPEISLLRKKQKIQKQQSFEVKECQTSEIESLYQSQPSKTHVMQTSVKKGSQDYQKRMSIQISKRRKSFQNKDGEMYKHQQQHPLIQLSENWSSQQLHKQKLSSKYQIPHYVNDFPGKYFEIFDQFDKFKDFQYYFPVNNPSTVLKEQKKKAYQALLQMRYNKLQVNCKQNPSYNSNEYELKSQNPSPKKLTGLQHLLNLRQQQQYQQQQQLIQLQQQLSSSRKQ